MRGPSSTEQILHPEKWIAVEQPLRVAIGAGKRLGPDWSRAAHGTLGEWMTRQLLEPAMPAGARSAATGWGGDAYELWRRDGAGECETPCARSTALVLRWRWDTRADARQFAAGADRYLEEALDARPARAGGRRARGAGVALARAPGGVSLVFAPTPSLATRLAKAQAR